ncbi:MAG: T9SS type A sorting domain-containing protein [Ignavibacteria bacterium]
MKTKIYFLILVSVFSLILISSLYLYASSSGFTGRTRKTSTAGCGGCHGTTSNTEVVVTLTGPDSVLVSQTATYTITISKSSKTGAGFDIATRRGSLSPISSGMIINNGELTHSSNRPMTNGTITLQFSYTAPGTAGFDTLWATALATNSDGTTSGDDWNWANEKKIVVKSSIGVRNISSQVPNEFELKQNYPNPFNPITTIRFAVPTKSFVSLKIYDISGRIVQEGISEYLNAGTYEYQFNGNNLSSGIYFYSLVGEGISITKKMILTK